MWFFFSRPDRLRDIADRFNLDQEAVLDNVLYARAYTSKYFVTNQLYMVQSDSCPINFSVIAKL